MRLTIDQGTLSAVLANVERATRKNSPTPTAGLILVGAEKRSDETRLRLSATDGQVGIDTTVAAEVRVEGQALVPAARLVPAVMAMPRGSSITMELKGERLRVSAGERAHVIATRDLSHAAKIPEPEKAKAIDLKTEHVRAILERISHIVPNVSEDHRERKGIWFDVDEGTLTGVVLANHMSGTLSFPEAFPKKTHWACLMPDPILPLLEKICSEAEEVQFLYTDTHVWALTPRTLLVSLRTAKEYPPWRQWMSSIEPEEISIMGRLGFIESVGAVTAGATAEDVDGVLLVFSAEKKTLELTFKSRIVGDSDGFDVLPVSAVVDTRMKVAPRYLLEMAKAASYDFHVQRLRVGDHYAIGFKTDDHFFGFIAGLTE